MSKVSDPFILAWRTDGAGPRHRPIAPPEWSKDLRDAVEKLAAMPGSLVAVAPPFSCAGSVDDADDA